MRMSLKNKAKCCTEHSNCTDGNCHTVIVVSDVLDAVKKLKVELCQRKSIGYPCGAVAKLCNHCEMIDVVFGRG